MKWNRQLLAGTLGVAVVVLVGGIWLERVVTTQLEHALRAELTTLRDTNLLALREWMQSQEKASSLAAAEPGVHEAALLAIRASVQIGEPDAAPDAAKLLQERLASTLRHWDFGGYLLLSGRRIVAADDPRYLGREIADSDYLQSLADLEDGGSLLTRPRQLGGGTEGDYVMWVASAIRNEQGIQGALAFRIDPAKSFARILRTARFGGSGETLTFDARGLLLSSSRFDEQLQKIGLLSAGQDSLLHLTLHDPGVDLTQDEQLPKNLDAHELTLDVRSAIDGRTDSDVDGYADYRGVRVAGAWTWLEEYGFGLATKVDWEEALASANVIRRVTRSLVGVLLFFAILLVFVGQLVSHLRSEARRLGQYTLQKKIGEGGMGSVYRAKHALLRRPTAIKMIKVNEIEEKTRVRFEREVQATAQLTHPNTIAIYDYGHTDEGVFYYAMEYLDGVTLYDLVRSSGPIGQARVVHILQQVLGSLSEAHESGLVHRDIKPSNIMLSLRGGVPDMVKVLDFGLVKDISSNSQERGVTATNALTGTPQYMSPESIDGHREVDQRSDLYAVAVVAYFLLTGREMFEGPTVLSVLTKHLTELPPKLSEQGVVIEPELEALIFQCLEKNPDARPRTAREIMSLLELLSEKPLLRFRTGEALLWWTNHSEILRSRDMSSANYSPTLAIDMGRRQA